LKFPDQTAWVSLSVGYPRTVATWPVSLRRIGGLPPLSKRSRDQLPNPIEDSADPYIPANRPAIGDLRGLFQF
jgi:hypothetical protein